MRFLIIPLLPLFAIVFSQLLGAHLPLLLGVIITAVILLLLSTYLLLWLVTGHRPNLFRP